MSTNEINHELAAQAKLDLIYDKMFKLADEIQTFFDGKSQIIVSGAVRILMLNMEDFRPHETHAADQIVRMHIKKETLKKRLEELMNGSQNQGAEKAPSEVDAQAIETTDKTS